MNTDGVVQANAERVSQKALDKAVRLIQRMSDLGLFQSKVKTANGVIQEWYNDWQFVADDDTEGIRKYIMEKDLNAYNIRNQYRSKQIIIHVEIGKNYFSMQANRLMHGYLIRIEYFVDKSEREIQNVHNHIWAVVLLEAIQKSIIPELHIYDCAIWHKPKIDNRNDLKIRDLIDPDGDLNVSDLRKIKAHDNQRLYTFYNTTEEQIKRYYMPKDTQDNSARLRILMVRQNSENVMNFEGHVAQVRQECDAVAQRVLMA